MPSIGLRAAGWWTSHRRFSGLSGYVSGTNATGSSSYGINAGGQIVGNYGPNTDNGAGYGFVYTIGGSAADLKLPSGGGGFYNVGNVNASGQAAASYSIGISPTNTSAIVYTNGSAGTGLGQGNGNGTAATAINNSGMLAGYGEIGADTTNDLLAYDGGWYDLGTLAGRSSQGKSIDSAGDVVGMSPNSSNKKMPVYVPNTGGADLGFGGQSFHCWHQ